MFFRSKHSGNHHYVQLVENCWRDGKCQQRVITTVGRLDKLQESGDLNALLQSGARFCRGDAGGDPLAFARSLGGAPHAKNRVLIVDDDPLVIRTIQRVLAPYQDRCEVEGCLDGVQALVRIGAWRPALVLLDIYMEGIDGFEVCRRLKLIQDLHRVSIVAMTAYPSEEARARILDYGALAYWTKPISAEQVLSVLETQQVQAVQAGSSEEQSVNW